MIRVNTILKSIELRNHKYWALNKPYFKPDDESERIITKDSTEYVRSFFSSKFRDIESLREDELMNYLIEHYSYGSNQNFCELDKQLQKNFDDMDVNALKERYKEDISEASFFWDQAMQFYKGTHNMDIHIRPLSMYYCMMNAAKALLVFNGVLYSDRDFKNTFHGVTGLKIKNYDDFLNKAEEHRVKYFEDKEEIKRVEIKQTDFNFTEIKQLFIQSNGGVFTNLGNYFGNNIKEKEIFSIDDLISNLVFVHRAYSISNDIDIENQLFIPLETQCFARYKSTKEYFAYYFQTDTNYNLPEAEYQNISIFIDDKVKHFMVSSEMLYVGKTNDYRNFIFEIRQKHQYIAGVKPRWYLMKETGSDTGRIKNLGLNPLVILLGIFHRLSEFSRYNPLKLKNLLDSKENETSWLLKELIDNACFQFLDLISSEITHKEFHLPRTF